MTAAAAMIVTAIASVGSGPGSPTMGTTTMTAGHMRPITPPGGPTTAPTPIDTSRALLIKFVHLRDAHRRLPATATHLAHARAGESHSSHSVTAIVAGRLEPLCLVIGSVTRRPPGGTRAQREQRSTAHSYQPKCAIGSRHLAFGDPSFEAPSQPTMTEQEP
jgi:hypothetical protein